MYTANTMSASFEALGMSLLGSSTMANTDAEKVTSAAASGRVLLEAIKRDLKPRDIITRDAIANAVRSEEHTSELQSRENLVCRLLLEKKKKKKIQQQIQ